MTSTDLVAIERQKRWEVDAVQRGVRRFREGLRQGGILSVGAGMDAAQDIVKHMVPEIKRVQKEALRRASQGSDGPGRPANSAPWADVFTMLEADTLAVVTVNSALARYDGDRGYARPWSGLSRDVADNVRLQISFEQWNDAEKGRERAARKAGELYPSLRARLQRSAKVIDRRAWRRFVRRLGLTLSGPWPKPLSLAVGSALLRIAVTHGGGWFEAVTVGVPKSGGKTELLLRLTEPAVAALEDMLRRNELARPMRVPMIAPPRPWIRKVNA